MRIITIFRATQAAMCITQNFSDQKWMQIRRASVMAFAPKLPEQMLETTPQRARVLATKALDDFFRGRLTMAKFRKARINRGHFGNRT